MLILGWIIESFVSALIWIVVGIYHVAAFAFELFLILASGQLLGADVYEQMITNFYIVLGIILLFVLAFALLRGMVNPDDQKQGTAVVKKVIINIITSAILMAVLPAVFSFAFDFQDAIIMKQNTIGKFFGYGTTGSTSDNPSSPSNLEKVQQGAYQIVNGVFTAFFNVNSDYCSKAISNVDDYSAKELVEKCQEETEAQDKKIIEGVEDKYSFKFTSDYVNATGSFGLYSGFSGNIDDEELDFNFLLSLISGLLLVYVAISFCFDMAVRLVKLVFYQLIAPIPIFFRVIPDSKLSGTFNQWVKITLTCYMEVYVRIFVFYFCIFLCNAIIQPGTFLGTDIYEYGWFLAFLAKAFVLMGIITFMRQAPKLISEVTGLDSGNMKLGIKDKLAAGGAFTAGAILGGGITTLVRNGVNAGQNIRNKYQENRTNGKSKFASVLGTTGTAVRGLGSVAAGTVSGAARSGKAGLNAKSAKDMKGAASSGATAAVNARYDRATYKSRHGGNIVGVVTGHAKDTLDTVGRWAGFDNIEELLAEQKIIRQIQGERKAIDNESFDVIDSDLAKGKGAVSYDSASAGHLGVTHDMTRLRQLKADLDAAKANGVAADIAAAEVAYSTYRADWADELRNISLQGETNWRSIDKSIQADLAKVRIASDQYRETVARNYNASYVSGLPNASDILDREKDLTVTHSTLKTIKDEMKIKDTEITSQINRIRQKEEEKKGK